MLQNLEEVQRFMDCQELAAFYTVGFGNRPHVVPVFFTFSDGKVYVQADRNSVKVCNLQANIHASMAVFQREEAVIIRGRARILESEEFILKTWDHVRKY